MQNRKTLIIYLFNLNVTEILLLLLFKFEDKYLIKCQVLMSLFMNRLLVV